MDKKQNSNDIYIVHGERKIPADKAITKIYQLKDGDIELRAIAKSPSNLRNFKKLSGSTYIDISTGEINSYQPKSECYKSQSSLNNSKFDLRRLIGNNFTGKPSEHHAVLTYRIPAQDLNQIYSDCKNFMYRLRYRYPKIEYIAIPDVSKKLNWHIHLLLKMNDASLLNIPNDELKNIWGNGITWIRHIKSKDSIKYYFVKHFNYTSNRYAEKFPKKSKLFRCSRGIDKVKTMKMYYKQAKELVRNHSPTYSKTIRIMKRNNNGTNEEINSITYENYTKEKNYVGKRR